MDMKIEEILPEPFEWCQIPAGSTIIIDENLSALGREEVGAFSISKYPITNAQYKVFIDASDGYTNELWWNFSKNAIRWRIDNSNARESAFQGEDQPRTNVTWYEAIAFCRWLARKTGRPIQLPTEQQWQRAAQGDDDRIYPWGNDFDKSFCNFKSYGTTPVTLYKKGASPFGVMDMCGNVLEWCLTKWGSQINTLNGNDRRILRGGSWHRSVLKELEVTYRVSNFPDFRVDNRGFRIVLDSQAVETNDIRPLEEKMRLSETQKQQPSNPDKVQNIENSRDERVVTQNVRAELLHVLNTYFDLEEIRTLCFEMKVDYDNLRGEGKVAKARELILYLERNDLVSQFLIKARKLRPNAPWPNAI